MPRIVYSPSYNINIYGLERIHPFDCRKYARCWKLLQQRFGTDLIRRMHIAPERPATYRELRRIHTRAYLANLRDPLFAARSLDIALVRYFPGWAVDWHILRPMRWATRGTILAAQAAVADGFAVNLSGGYHHAKPHRGTAASIYSDIGIAVKSLRLQRAIGDTERVLYIDTDAHQGNGVCHVFMSDPRVQIFDMFNSMIFPLFDGEARSRIDYAVGLETQCSDLDYLHELRAHLPDFLDASCQDTRVGLAIYNAGTDVLAGDPMGGLQLSPAAVVDRDQFVVEQLRARGIPTVMLLSGGYTSNSYQVVADSVGTLIAREWERVPLWDGLPSGLSA